MSAARAPVRRRPELQCAVGRPCLRALTCGPRPTTIQPPSNGDLGSRMKQLSTVKTLIGFAIAAALAGGCDDELEFFRSCPLSSSIIEVCREDQPNTDLTCVVTEHPMCDERVCAAWEGSGSFCSRTCELTSDCPPDSVCLPYLQGLDISVCVPNERPPAGQLGL